MSIPNETQQAIQWALQSEVIIKNDEGNEIERHVVNRNIPSELVDKVREYFNTNNIEYSTFSYDDLIPYLTLSE